MAKRWTKEEEKCLRKELNDLYVRKNLPIRKIGEILCISEKTVFKRLKRLGIATNPSKKEKFLNKRHDFRIPVKRSNLLAEFFGIMLGDGHISKTQVIVSLGDKEESYALHVVSVFERLFGVTPKISIRKLGYRDVYFGSVELVKWFKQEGLVHNKTKSQVDMPEWIFEKESYMKAVLRGFFDTDGSVYRIRNGIQISLSNRSIPLLLALHKALVRLQYSPSNVSSFKVYLTKKTDLSRFFYEIKPSNAKHLERYTSYSKSVDTQAVNEDGL